MSITTQGWGSTAITTAGWGGGVGVLPPSLLPPKVNLKDVPLIDIGTLYDLRIATLEHTCRKKIATTVLIQDRDVLVSKTNQSLSQCESLETQLHRLEINLKQLEADRRLTQTGTS